MGRWDWCFGLCSKKVCIKTEKGAEYIEHYMYRIDLISDHSTHLVRTGVKTSNSSTVFFYSFIKTPKIQSKNNLSVFVFLEFDTNWTLNTHILNWIYQIGKFINQSSAISKNIVKPIGTYHLKFTKFYPCSL